MQNIQLSSNCCTLFQNLRNFVPVFYYNLTFIFYSLLLTLNVIFIVESHFPNTRSVFVLVNSTPTYTLGKCKAGGRKAAGERCHHCRHLLWSGFWQQCRPMCDHRESCGLSEGIWPACSERIEVRFQCNVEDCSNINSSSF